MPFHAFSSALFAALPLLAQPPAQKPKPAPAHVKVETLPARPEDVGSVDGIVKAYYEVVSGAAGVPRQWARDRSLYIPQLHFVSAERDKAGKLSMRVRDHQGYVDSSDDLTKSGFFEKEIHRVTKAFGALTHVWSTYESRRTQDGPVIARGINSIEIFFDGKRHWITFAQWDDETPASPIPREFLP